MAAEVWIYTRIFGILPQESQAKGDKGFEGQKESWGNIVKKGRGNKEEGLSEKGRVTINKKEGAKRWA